MADLAKKIFAVLALCMIFTAGSFLTVHAQYNTFEECEAANAGLDCEVYPRAQAGNNSADQVIPQQSCGPNMERVNGLCVPKGGFGGIAGAKDFAGLVNLILNMLLYVAGIISVLFIIVGGYQYMTSGGNDEQAEKGKKTIVNAVIGVVLTILSYTIVNVVINAVTK